MMYSLTTLFAILAFSFVGIVAGKRVNRRRLELVDSQDAKWFEHLDVCAFVDYQVFLLVEGNHGSIVATPPQETEGKKECTTMVFDSNFGQGYEHATKRVASPFEEIEQENMLYLGTKSFQEVEEAFQLASPADGVYDVVAKQTCADFVLSFLKILNFPVDENVVEYNAMRLAKEKVFVDLVRNHPETKKQTGSQVLSDLDLMRALTKYYLSEN